MPKLTPRTAKDAVRWAMERLGLHAWKVAVELSDEWPAWGDKDQGQLGLASWDDTRRIAQVWASPTRNDGCQEDTIGTLFHEVLHIALSDSSIRLSGGERSEYALNMIADMMAELYERRKR